MDMIYHIPKNNFHGEHDDNALHRHLQRVQQKSQRQTVGPADSSEGCTVVVCRFCSWVVKTWIVKHVCLSQLSQLGRLGCVIIKKWGNYIASWNAWGVRSQTNVALSAANKSWQRERERDCKQILLASCQVVLPLESAKVWELAGVKTSDDQCTYHFRCTVLKSTYSRDLSLVPTWCKWTNDK